MFKEAASLPRLKRPRLVLGLALGVAFFATAPLVRALILRKLTESMVEGIAEVSRSLEQRSFSTEVEEDFLPFIGFKNLGVRDEAAGDELVEEEGRKPLIPLQRSSTAGTIPAPQSVRVGEETVLKWAEAQAVPTGRSRPAEAGMPAGIELSQVDQLGIGLIEGDRLVGVNGVSVLQRAEVVHEVLGARGRGDEVIVAQLVRVTKDGVIPFSVAIEQPYRAFQ